MGGDLSKRVEYQRQQQEEQRQRQLLEAKALSNYEARVKGYQWEEHGQYISYIEQCRAQYKQECMPQHQQQQANPKQQQQPKSRLG
jgi:hypothetical protein